MPRTFLKILSILIQSLSQLDNSFFILQLNFQSKQVRIV